MLLEYWHTTYLEEGVCDCGSSQPGGDRAVKLDSGDALEYWHTTYLEEGVCEGGSGQPGGDGAVELDGGDAVLGMVEGLVHRRQHQDVEEGGDALGDDGSPELQGPDQI
jgi:hypothetical protein